MRDTAIIASQFCVVLFNALGSDSSFALKYQIDYIYTTIHFYVMIKVCLQSNICHGQKSKRVSDRVLVIFKSKKLEQVSGSNDETEKLYLNKQ